jgi:hypothetical protein
LIIWRPVHVLFGTVSEAACFSACLGPHICSNVVKLSRKEFASMLQDFSKPKTS